MLLFLNIYTIETLEFIKHNSSINVQRNNRIYVQNTLEKFI